MTQKERDRRRRRDFTNQVCACGNQAIAFKRSDFICERCDRIEEMRKSEERAMSLKARYDTAKHRARYGDTDSGILQAA